MVFSIAHVYFVTTMFIRHFFLLKLFKFSELQLRRFYLENVTFYNVYNHFKNIRIDGMIKSPKVGSLFALFFTANRRIYIFRIPFRNISGTQ